MRSNKGFSLVEMIVAFAILAVCGLAVFGFMQSGQNSFTRTSTDVGLQYEQQVVVNQLRDLLLESTNSAKYDPEHKMLYSYSQDVTREKNESTGDMEYVYNYTVTRVSLDETNNKLMWNEKDFTKDNLPATLDAVVESFDDEGNRLLGDNVKEIEFDMSKLKEGQITFTITFISDDGKEISSTQVVMLRNKLTDTDDFGIMYTDLSEEKNSFIKGIRMSRDGVEFPLISGNIDEIKKDSVEDVSVQYEAVVTASTYSEYSYECYFEISEINVPAGFTIDEGDISVGNSSGVVTVKSTVPNNTTFRLWAISVDEPSRIKTDVTVTVRDGGLYPSSAKLTEQTGLQKDEAGKRVYVIYPSITYSNGTTKSGQDFLNLLTYVVKRDGQIVEDAFNPATGELTVSSADNDHTFTIMGYVKQKSARAEVIKTNPGVTINVTGVSSAAANQMLALSTSSYKDNLRGSNDITAAVTWINANSSLYNYHWSIEPVNVPDDDKYGVWGDTDVNSFNKNISFTSNNLSNVTTVNSNLKTADSDRNHTGIYLTCQETLQWTKYWRIKVTCYATSAKAGDDQTKKYGLSNEKGEYLQPAEAYLDIEPVKLVLSPYAYGQNNAYVGTGAYLKNIQIKDGNNEAKAATRVFKAYIRGLKVTVNDLYKYNQGVEMKFYNGKGTEISTQIGSDLYGLGDTKNNETYMAFKVNVRPKGTSKKGASAMLNYVSVINARLYLTDKNYSTLNIAKAYYMPEGITNYSDDANLTDMFNVSYYVQAENTFEARGYEVD